MDFDLTSSYDYELPSELIADRPADRRTASRLLVGDVQSGGIRHRSFGDLPELLAPDDLLVFNDTRVVSARVDARKETGGAVELFVVDVLDPQGPDRWETSAERLELQCMTRSSKPPRVGQRLFAGRAQFERLAYERGIARVAVQSGQSAEALLSAVGSIPLPPYIVRRRAELGLPSTTDADSARYQTVYARKPGAVAAPTAGLHFDDALLGLLTERGVRQTTLTLNVGPGTFRPVSTDRLSDHPMHTESYEAPPELGDMLADTRSAGGRVIAVGTTCVRALEAEARRDDAFVGGARATDIFIKPGFRFEVVDAMITNFHLPRSTLLALVFAFGGPDFMRTIYETAVAERYRFYSYGDAMLLGSGF